MIGGQSGGGRDVENRRVDAVRVGRSLRALRIRRRWRQSDLGARAGISAAQCSRLERGDLRGVRLAHVEAVCTALGADLDVRVRWHGEGLDRLLDADHAALVNSIVRRLDRVGWESHVEVSFNEYGERGSIDVLAWNPIRRGLLVIEVKSVVPDVQATIASLDRKMRLGPVIARRRGWAAIVSGSLLVVGESSTSRQRIATHADLFNRAYPDRAHSVRRWLVDPVGRLAGLIFLRNDPPDRATHRFRGKQRVRRSQAGRVIP